VEIVEMKLSCTFFTTECPKTGGLTYLDNLLECSLINSVKIDTVVDLGYLDGDPEIVPGRILEFN
jgi:hypothetical protein